MSRPLLLTVLLAAFLAAGPRPLAAQDAGGAGRAAATVNLNTATAEQLEALPGIGPRTAVRIVEYRQKSGGFKKVEDLMNVQGIGEKGFLKIKPMVTVGAAKPAGPAQ
jgi:competence protein ComEA